MGTIDKYLLGTASAALIVSTLFAAPARATPATGFTAVQTIKGTYPEIDLKSKGSKGVELMLKTKNPIDLYVVRNAIAIGGQSGWHTHPGPSLITVTIGTITAYEGPLCTPTRYTAGQGFIDQGGGEVHLIRNESGAVAETVAVQFLPVGAVRRIDAPKPNNCLF